MTTMDNGKLKVDNAQRSTESSQSMPKGWVVKKLGDVCDVLDKLRKPITKRDRIDGKYPYYGATGILSYINDYIFDEKLVLIGEDGAKWFSGANSSFIVKGKYWVNNHAHVIRPSRDVILDEWIVYFLNHSDLSEYVTGMTVPKLNQGNLRAIQIPIPPLTQQKQIVKILDKAFTAIDKAKNNAQQNLLNAKQLFESYLQNVFENNVSGTQYDALNDICELIVDCEHKTAPKQETGYPSIRTPNIGQGVLILEGVNRVSEETYIKWTRRAIPKEDDLILAREAPAGNIGVIPKNIKVCLGQRTVLIRPKKDKFISKYLAFLILSKKVQKQLLSHSTGATVQHINMKDIRAFKIYSLPTLKEQIKIRNSIDRILAQTKKIEAIYEQKIADLEELKKSVLQKAFSGALTQKELV